MASGDYAHVLQALRRSDAEIHSLFRSGSRVYGTARPDSDEDFVAVLARRDARRDLAFAPGLNVVIHGLDTFRAAIAEQSVFALECLFLPAEHRLKEGRPPFAYKLDRARLAASATARSDADFAKAGKRFADEPDASKKRLFHSLRVPMFAIQIAREGRIVDYGQANHFLVEIQELPSDAWEDFAGIYRPVRDRLSAELAALAARRSGRR